MILGLVLLLVGVIALLANAAIFPVSALSYLWPALLILAGVLILVARTIGRKSRLSSGCCGCGEEKRPENE